MTLEEWRDVSARWRKYGWTKMADDLDALLARLERVEELALHHPNAEEGDRLRKVLWPSKAR